MDVILWEGQTLRRNSWFKTLIQPEAIFSKNNLHANLTERASLQNLLIKSWYLWSWKEGVFPSRQDSQKDKENYIFYGSPPQRLSSGLELCCAGNCRELDMVFDPNSLQSSNEQHMNSGSGEIIKYVISRAGSTAYYSGCPIQPLIRPCFQLLTTLPDFNHSIWSFSSLGVCLRLNLFGQLQPKWFSHFQEWG